MPRIIMLLLAGLLLPEQPDPLCSCGPKACPGHPQGLCTEESRVLRDVNKLRRCRGLGPLKIDFDMQRIAQAHSQRMSQTGGVWHSRYAWPECVGLSQFYARFPDLFMESSPHRAILMDPSARRAAVGLWWESDAVYCTIEVTSQEP